MIMIINIALTTDKGAENKAQVIMELFDRINEFIKERDYGQGIYEYLLSINFTNSPLGYEHLNVIFKPKYTEYKSTTNRFTGEELVIRRQFHYSIAIDRNLYFRFINSSKEECKKLLIVNFLESLSYLDTLPKKIDFDKEKFKTDIESLLA
jgi:hypothetical protein